MRMPRIVTSRWIRYAGGLLAGLVALAALVAVWRGAEPETLPVPDVAESVATPPEEPLPMTVERMRDPEYVREIKGMAEARRSNAARMSQVRQHMAERAAVLAAEISAGPTDAEHAQNADDLLQARLKEDPEYAALEVELAEWEREQARVDARVRETIRERMKQQYAERRAARAGEPDDRPRSTPVSRVMTNQPFIQTEPVIITNRPAPVAKDPEMEAPAPSAEGHADTEPPAPETEVRVVF